MFDCQSLDMPAALADREDIQEALSGMLVRAVAGVDD
jgi:hypothetical protein